MNEASRSSVRSTIRTLGLSGASICVHSSFRSFGPVDGGPVAIVEGMLDEDCTLIVPTFSDDFAIPPPADMRPRRNGWNYEAYPGSTKGVGRIFTPQTNEITLEEMGVIPATVLSHPHRIRGAHTLCSFAAVGPRAMEFISVQTMIDVFAPLKLLSKTGGWVILMGVGLDAMTLIHAAEEHSGRHPFIRWANGLDGRPLAVATGGCSNGFGHLEQVVSPYARSHMVGKSRWQIFPARETMDSCSKAIKEKPEITRCDNEHCERCDDAIKGGPIIE